MIKTKNNSGNYDTTINVIGGLKDCSIIYHAVDSFFADGNLRSDNTVVLRTEKSRKRVQVAIKEGVLKFYNQEHKELLESIFKSYMPTHEKEMVLFWQFALCNRLFREISLDVFLKIYFSGRATISKEDIAGYLKDLINRNENSKIKWTENTTMTLATKYLNFLTKLSILEGERTKTVRNIKLSSELLVLFLYFVRIYDKRNNILQNEMLPFSFVSRDDFSAKLKKLALKGFFNMNFTGNVLNVELTHSYQGICDVLYN